MINIIGVKELRENLPAFVREVRRGRSFLVVKRSKPVFQITPVEDSRQQEWENVVDFTKIKKGGVPIDEALARL